MPLHITRQNAQFNYLSTMGFVPYTGMTASSQTVGTINMGHAAIVRPERTIVVAFLNWFGGAVSAGNYDIGIYSADGSTKLWSKGSTAWPAINAGVTETVSPTVTLNAGTDYLAIISGDQTTSCFRGVAPISTQGQLADGSFIVKTVTSAFPLGSSITLGSQTGAKVPLVVFRES